MAQPERRQQPVPDPVRALPTNAEHYGWLGDDSRPYPPVDGTLLSRFDAPGGYQRIQLSKGSFGEWLRSLPVAPEGTPVVDYKGNVAMPGDDKYVAGVIAIDVGKKNLQHGPDVIIRLHAEWMWASGNAKSLSYESVTRLDMPLERFLKGDRVKSRGGRLDWIPLAKPADPPEHEDLRDYLDSVFNWINSVSLLSQAKEIEQAELRPGDFLVHDGSPGDAIIVLDMARDVEHGRTLVMLGRALSPAQSVHVVSPGAKIAWFEVSPHTPLLTPHTEEFEWDGLRRLP